MRARHFRLPLGRIAILLLVWTAVAAGCSSGFVVPAREEAAADAARPAMEPHPSDAYFALDRVLDVAIEMAPEDWDRLRRQTRTLADVRGGVDCLDHPPEDIFSWFLARVTVDGEGLAQVGVRKKGGTGSMSEEKPALKVRFDKFVDDQLLGGVMKRLTLNNVRHDDSKLNTCMAYRVFAAAGLPAPRCNFAAVTVNGDDLGLYVHVESIKTAFLERHFADAQGYLYEGSVSDFRPKFRGTFEKKTRADEGDWSDIDAVIAALQDPSPAGLEALAAAIDLDRFLTFWATEALIGHWDGYANNRTNFYVYRESDADAPLTFIPWGVDSVFRNAAFLLLPPCRSGPMALSPTACTATTRCARPMSAACGNCWIPSGAKKNSWRASTPWRRSSRRTPRRPPARPPPRTRTGCAVSSVRGGRSFWMSWNPNRPPGLGLCPGPNPNIVCRREALSIWVLRRHGGRTKTAIRWPKGR